MAKFCSLFSSSSGNCTYIGSENSGILIDAGVSAKRITSALTDRGIDPKSIKAIFVTHEHTDHIKGIRVFASNLSIPVFATEGTLNGMREANMLTEKFSANGISYGEEREIDDMLIKSFKTPHDSLQSCGYTVTFSDGKKISVATDLGHITDEITDNISSSDLVLIESNHDIGMLENGDYPYFLKRRILSDVGHLCNEKCAETVRFLLEKGVTRFYLGHLSEQNNIPDLAYQTTYAALCEAGAKNGIDYLLTVCPKENDRGIIKF